MGKIFDVNVWFALNRYKKHLQRRLIYMACLLPNLTDSEVDLEKRITVAKDRFGVQNSP